MPHAIDQTTGTPAFVFNSENGVPWHHLGTPVKGLMTKQQVLEAAPSLAFGVRKVPVLTIDGTPIPGWCATIREDTGAPLGMVTTSYQIFQTDEMLDWGDALVDSGEAHYETAGALFGGRTVFALMALDTDIVVPGDNGSIMRFLLLYTGHDGRHALTGKMTMVRVVCANTFSLALRGAGNSIVLRHTSGIATRLEDARRALGISLAYTETFEKVMADLMKQAMTDKDVTDFTEALLPIKEGIEVATRTETLRSEILAIYRNSANLDGVPGSAYRALQAVAEWADHSRTYRTRVANGSAADARAMSILEGTAADTKQRALALLAPAAAPR